MFRPEDVGVSVKDNLPAASALVVNNSGLVNISLWINIAVLVFMLVQIGYTVWKWRRDYKELQRELLPDLMESEDGSRSGGTTRRRPKE